MQNAHSPSPKSHPTPARSRSGFTRGPEDPGPRDQEIITTVTAPIFTRPALFGTSRHPASVALQGPMAPATRLTTALRPYMKSLGAHFFLIHRLPSTTLHTYTTSLRRDGGCLKPLPRHVLRTSTCGPHSARPRHVSPGRRPSER